MSIASIESLGSFPPPYSDGERSSTDGASSSGVSSGQDHHTCEKGSQEPLKKVEESDQIINAIGQFGIWQGCLFLSMGLALFPGMLFKPIGYFGIASLILFFPRHLSNSGDDFYERQGRVLVRPPSTSLAPGT